MAKKIPMPDEDATAPTRKTRTVHASRPEAAQKSATSSAGTTSKATPPRGRYTRDNMVSVKLGPDLKAELDAARHRTALFTGSGTVADFVRDAVEAHIKTLQRKYNGGESFLAT